MTSRVPIAGFTMKTTLRPGLVHVLSYRLTEARTPPSTLSCRTMPRGSGTASMVGLIQWASMEAIRPHLGAGEHSVGLDIEILHAADVTAGLVAHVEIVVERVEGRKVFFRVKAYDGDRAIGEGTHERFVIDRERLHPGAGRTPRRASGHPRPSRRARVHDTRRVGRA
jgi:fluoroacetyl-CoA thioesterase